MRIAYIVAAFPKASETFVSREVLALEERGIEVEVFALVRPSENELERLAPEVRKLAERVRYIDVPQMLAAAPFAATQLEAIELNGLLSKRCRGNPVARLLRAAAIALKLQEGKFERVHAHWPQATQLAILVHAMTRLPISASIHAHEVAHDTGHFGLAFERLEFASFCNRAAMEKLLAELPSGSASRCHLVYHGVSLGRFVERPMPALAGELRLFSAGRLTPTKGFDRLIRAVARAKELGTQVHLTIAGEGAERQKLEDLSKQLGVSDRVELPGWVPHDKMAELVGRTHAFALLANCDFHDGLPNAVLEAMASGRPAILSPLPAAAEAIEHGKTGFILSAPDAIDECAALFGELVRAPERLTVLGQKAHVAARDNFDDKRAIERLLDLFRGRDTQQGKKRPSKGPTLSLVTIAKNEERDLPNFLASFLPWVDEVVICDDGSTDRTEDIARAAGPKVKFVRSPRGPGEGFHSQRNKAIDLATGDWLLHVDVDMRLTPDFAREVHAAIADESKDLYIYRRANYFLNQRLFHAMSPQTPFPWLVRKGLARFKHPVHEQLDHTISAERTGTLHNRLHHLGDDDFEERLRKNVLYSIMERDKTRAAGRVTTMKDLLLRPPYLAAKSYLYNKGFLDGRTGVFWALYQASSSLNRYLLEYADNIRLERAELDKILMSEGRELASEPEHSHGVDSQCSE